MAPERIRLDQALVARGLCDSRARAQAEISAGRVRVGGVTVTRSAHKVADGDALTLEGGLGYVSRAALKLKAALDMWPIVVAGRRALDVGASTGGFTQVLLEAGAARVAAVDVGHGQLHADLAADPRVRSLEGQDARALTVEQVGFSPELIVCDASFIGLAKVIGRPLELAAASGELVALFKPQFEVGPENVGKGGIVRNRVAAEVAEAAFTDWLTGVGWDVCGQADSPITGKDGNAERLIWAQKRSGGHPNPDDRRVVSAGVDQPP